MKNERLILLMLAVTQFTHIVDFMIVMPLGAEFMEMFDITPTQFSWIVSVYALAASIMGLFGAMYILIGMIVKQRSWPAIQGSSLVLLPVRCLQALLSSF